MSKQSSKKNSSPSTKDTLADQVYKILSKMYPDSPPKVLQDTTDKIVEVVTTMNESAAIMRSQMIKDTLNKHLKDPVLHDLISALENVTIK